MKKKLVALLLAAGFFSSVALAEEYVSNLNDSNTTELIDVIENSDFDPNDVCLDTIMTRFKPSRP